MELFGAIFTIFFSLGLMAFGIYWIILIIKLARRGIKALDIYINKNSNSNNMFQ
jgi:hypothetical protein